MVSRLPSKTKSKLSNSSRRLCINNNSLQTKFSPSKPQASLLFVPRLTVVFLVTAPVLALLLVLGAAYVGGPAAGASAGALRRGFASPSKRLRTAKIIL